MRFYTMGQSINRTGLSEPALHKYARLLDIPKTTDGSRKFTGAQLDAICAEKRRLVSASNVARSLAAKKRWAKKRNYEHTTLPAIKQTKWESWNQTLDKYIIGPNNFDEMPLSLADVVRFLLAMCAFAAISIAVYLVVTQ